MKSWAKAHERIDDLQLNGLKIIQNPEGFCFGIDAVLLSDFTKVKDGATVVELGTGTGIIPLLLSAKTKAAQISAFEVQESMAEMAKRSVDMNGLGERIRIIQDNLKNYLKYFEKSSVDVVVSNPPYMSGTSGIHNDDDLKRISRHEILCNLEDIIRVSASMLKPGGCFYMVHRPNRLVDIVCLMRQYKLEPKEVRFIQPKRDKKPNIMLIKGVRGGRADLKYLDPLVVYQENGEYTAEIYEIYGNAKIDVFDKRGEIGGTE